MTHINCTCNTIYTDNGHIIIPQKNVKGQNGDLKPSIKISYYNL